MAALTGHTVFISYLLVPETLTNLINQANNEYYDGIIPPIPPIPPTSIGVGNSKYVHCNYIKRMVLSSDDPKMEQIVVSFQNIDDFKFLSDDVYNITGYTANKIYTLIQLVENSGFTTIMNVKPDSAKWKKYNITNQITTYSIGDYITPAMLTSQLFKIPLKNYDNFDVYNISDYINYPTKQASDDTDLCFGEEELFFGNITTNIKAIAYTTDVAISLGLNEFNSTTNETWDGNESVVISEVGIYDNENNLVAIGKLNNPIPKDSTITRTIVFDIDF